MYRQELIDHLNSYADIYMYGAGVVAFGAYKAIQKLYNITVKSFLVTSAEGQPCQIENIPVNEVGKAGIDKAKGFVLIAAPEEYHCDMEYQLIRLGIFNYYKLDAQIEYRLMSAYLKEAKNLHLVEEYQITGRTYPEGACRVYMAVSHKDKKLQHPYREKTWIRKVQAGAALTEKRITEITDKGIDSLSMENALYGELTVTYYIWKYNRYAVTGLFHYRRVLEVTEGQLALLWNNEVDVILPLPFVCTPDASGQYGRYLLPEDIEIMREVLQEREPQHSDETANILKMPYLYNYNMLIARKEIFNTYCEWLFPLLREIAYRCEKITRDRQPRYIGRIGEILTSLYFMRNENHLRIAHAKKVWRI